MPLVQLKLNNKKQGKDRKSKHNFEIVGGQELVVQAPF
jgi:hypothetical protein